jgi:hypothetical protein
MNKFLPEREGRSIIVQVSLHLCPFYLCSTHRSAGCVRASLFEHAGNLVTILISFISTVLPFINIELSEKQNHSLRSETCQCSYSSGRGRNMKREKCFRLSLILFFQVKITDFGLSKVMSEEEHEGGGMELTSQVCRCIVGV